MRKKSRLVVGIVVGLLLASLAVAHEEGKFELQCNNGICCTINQENGEIVDCMVVE
jgi:hypothetical protein